MIAGLTRMTSPVALIRYLVRSKDGSQEARGHYIGGTVIATGEDDLCEHFQWLCALRPDVVCPIEHGWISLAPGEKADRIRKLDMATRFATEMKWQSFAVIEHQDAPQDHFHVIGTRIGADGSVSREQLRQFRRVERLLRHMEIQYGYRRVESPKRPRTTHGRSSEPSTNARERAARAHGRPSLRQELRTTLESVLAEGFRRGRVLLEMHRRGWEPQTTWRSGHPVGISWRHRDTGVTIRASRLGNPLLAGRAFFNHIGGLDGEHRSGHRIIDPNFVPLDFDKHWRQVLRRLGGRYGTLARGPLPGTSPGQPRG